MTHVADRLRPVPPRPSFRIGLGLAVLGIAAIVATFVAGAVMTTSPPLGLYLLSLLLPAGMVVLAVAVARDHRRASR